MKRSCECQGFNENCFKCFGRGYYEEQDLHYHPPPFNKTTNFPSNPKRVLKQTKKIQCPHCKAHVREGRFKNHVSRCPSLNAGNRKVVKEKDKILTQRDGFTQCLKCNAAVKTDRLHHHMRKAHDDSKSIHKAVSIIFAQASSRKGR